MQERQWPAVYGSALRLPVCHTKLCQTCTCAARLIVALAGVPGSGKSTIAVEVCKQLNATLGQPLAVVVPMDGAAYPCETYCKRAPVCYEAALRTAWDMLLHVFPCVVSFDCAPPCVSSTRL